MRKSLCARELGFVAQDRQRLSKAMAGDMKLRLFRRTLAVLLVAKGRSFAEAAEIVGWSLRSVYYLVHRYLQSHPAPRLGGRAPFWSARQCAPTDKESDSVGTAARLRNLLSGFEEER